MRLRARWVVPVSSPPLDDGWIDVADDRITDVGHGVVDGGRGNERDLGHVALMPGLVNAHTHIELSYLAGAVAPASRFTDWIREVMALRRAQPDAAAPQIVDAARDAIAAMEAAGTAAVGDISNTLVTVPLLNAASLAAAVFFELLRFRGREAATVIEQAAERVRNATPAPHVRVWPAPHAPYSVSAPLFQALRRWLDRSPLARTSVHLAESVQETDLLASGKGPFRDLLEDLGAWDDEWTPPGCGPVEYLERLAFLRPRTLAVHGVQMDDVDLRRIARAGATLVTCPRSNRHVGVGDPPIGRFYESGVPIAIGTDSLASAPDLGVFGELAAMRALAPEVPAARLLESATLVGARALGCAQWLGSIEAGKSARLLAVTIPPGVGNVMEYLVSEVELAHVRWAPLPAERRDAGAYSWN